MSKFEKLNHISSYEIIGRVTAIRESFIEAAGLESFAKLGSVGRIINRKGIFIDFGETIAIESKKVKILPFGSIKLISLGDLIELTQGASEYIYPDQSWLGRVMNAMSRPIDNLGTLQNGDKPYYLYNSPPPAYERQLIARRLETKIKAIDLFIPCYYGQRLALMAGSGVGKSVLTAMITKYAQAEVKIIGLIGERGREVREFIEHYLGSNGLKEAIVVVATSDESALMRRRAAHLVLTISEYFRDLGKDVICFVDSVTRFAMAQRQIDLISGELPTSRGYTPSVFNELPKLLERAGPGKIGSITGFFSVLVEGDDHNEPIADTVRGTVDGHIVMERAIAERGRFPAINISKSISRVMLTKASPAINKTLRIISDYYDMEDLIKLGAYKSGSNAKIDEAIKYFDKLEDFLKQAPEDAMTLSFAEKNLENIYKD